MSAPRPVGHLTRILGLGFGLAVIFGGTVGVGILRLPGEIAGQLGSARLLFAVWILGGVYSLLGAISLSEVGAALPRAGGFYVYSQRAFGPAAGFCMGWADWMVNCSSMAYAVVAASEYLAALLPGTILHNPYIQTAVALALLAMFCVLHWFGLKLSSRVQKLTSSVTAITFIALAVACLLHPRPAVQEAITQPRVGQLEGVLGVMARVIVILPAIVVAFDGWYEAIYFTEEDTNAAKHLPRAMIGGVLMITSLYLLMNVAFLHVLSIGELGHSKLAAADAARVVFPALNGSKEWSGTFVTVLSMLTLLSLTNALLMGATRILFAVGRDGLVAATARVSSSGTPRTAMWMTAAMAGVLVASGRFDDIVAVAAILMATAYTVNYTAVIVLRFREPNLARPFKAWGYPFTTGLVLLGSLAFLILDLRQDPVSGWRSAVLLGAALPVYWWLKRRRSKEVAGDA
jgi:APA family basic amino acid/polyamine antiporter